MASQRYPSLRYWLFFLLLIAGFPTITTSARQDAPLQPPLQPMRFAPDSDSVIEGEYIVVYKAEHARTAAQSREWVRSLGGQLLYTYEHALQGFAVTQLSADALTQIQNDPAVAYIEQNQWFIAPTIPLLQGDTKLWLPFIARAEDDSLPSPTPSTSPTATILPSSTATNTPSATATTTITVTPSVTPSASATPSATATTTASPTSTVTPSATATPTIAATHTATATPSPTATATVVVQEDATWGLDRIDQRLLPLNNTYTYRLNGAGVHAYIVDSGIRPTHLEFTGRMGNGYDAVDDDDNPDDCLGHGTHVAGSVGGSTYGVAKEVTLHGVRVLACNGGGTLAGILAGVDWIAGNYQSPAVVNMSLGGPVNATIDAAVESLIAEGLPVVVAAGNSNIDACTRSPAHIPDVVTVGSTDMADVRSSFSNWGSCLDLFAPGSAILSAWHTSDSATNTIDGTSHAAPHVAGLVVLYLSNHPTATPSEVTAFILANATPNLVADPQGSPNLLLFSPYGEPPALLSGRNTPH